MAHAETVRRAGTRPARQPHRFRGEFFSLGRLLAPFATTRLALAPWAVSAAFLTVLALWDPVARGGEFDAILMGLAAYELLIGLTTTQRPGADPAVECVRPEAPAS